MITLIKEKEGKVLGYFTSKKLLKKNPLSIYLGSSVELKGSKYKFEFDNPPLTHRSYLSYGNLEIGARVFREIGNLKKGNKYVFSRDDL